MQLKSDELHNDLIQSSDKNLPELDFKNPFCFYDLELTELEKKCLQELKITNLMGANSYENFGNKEGIVPEIIEFLLSLGENSIASCQIIAQLIERLVEKVRSYFEQETAWLCIRASMPHPLFKIPRWHTDGFYYKSSSDYQCKAAITLKGPQTLFFNASQEQRMEMEKVSLNYMNQANDIATFMTKENEMRLEISKIFDMKMAVTAQFGLGSLFIAGPQGAVHSEPDITEPRIFLNILPGSFDQIKEWQEHNQPQMLAAPK